VGLGGLARCDDFVGRQLARLLDVWGRTKTRELPLMKDLHDRLAAKRPVQRHTGLVHSDFRFGNAMLSPAGDVVALLDWELCTVGDVLADLGFLLNNWEGQDDDGPSVWMEVPPTVAGGFWSRDEVVGAYAARTGFELDDIEFYRAFSYWRMAVIAEGINRRYASRAMATDAVDFDHLERRVEDLAALADMRLRSVTG
jgi:aminoglycoside phosphotransferase (APT) family kinase protein